MNWLRKFWLVGEESALEALACMARRRGRTPQAEHLQTGLRGEDAAYFYLRRKGYLVVARRWSSGTVPGDLDLIAWKGERLCIIEVKTRTAHDLAPAEAAVDDQKRRTVCRLARQYIGQLPQQQRPAVRFDVLSVYLIPGQPKEFVHIEAAFGWSAHDPDWRQ
jgi:putative endonuclease